MASGQQQEVGSYTIETETYVKRRILVAASSQQEAEELVKAGPRHYLKATLDETISEIRFVSMKSVAGDHMDDEVLNEK